MKTDNAKNLIRFFRMAGIAEGISFLVLLFIAMPMKYWMDIPEAVKITGWVHGALFITFIYLAFSVMGELKKNFIWFLKALAAAFLPFGTFIFDRQLKKEQALLSP